MSHIRTPNWRPPFATSFPGHERIAFAVSQLPVAHGGFRHIDQECHAGCQNTDQGSYHPSRSFIEKAQELVANPLSAVNGSKTI